MKTTILFLLSLLLFASCKKEEFGSLSVSLKDGPANHQEINVDIQKVEVLIAEKNLQKWYPLNTNKGIYNLLLFENVPVMLATHGKIPSGPISQLRLTLGSNNSLKTGNEYYPMALPAPPNRQFTVTIPADFRILSNQTLHVIVDIDAERSVLKKGSGRYLFEPVAISATINSPLDLY